MSNIAICLPCYSGEVSLHWMATFMNTRDILTREGIRFEFLSIVDCGIIQFARNDLVSQALKTEADIVLFVDGRQLWEPVGILRLIDDLKTVDVVAAPAVSIDGKFFANYSEDQPEETHLKKTTHCSVAFMGLNRHVLEDLIKKHPELEYENDSGTHYDLFDTMIENKKFIGEDTAFSLRLIRAGHDIYVDEGIRVKRLK